MGKPWESPRWPEDVNYEVSGYEKPLYTLLDGIARSYPDSVYTVFAGSTRTYLQVKESAERVAQFLASKGLRSGDRVAVFLPNIPHYPEIFFGILKAGAVCVTCNPLYKSSELHFQLRDAEVKAAFVMDHPTLYPTAVGALPGTRVDTVVVCNVRSHLPRLKGLLGSVLGKVPAAKHIRTDHTRYEHIMKSTPADTFNVRVRPSEDTAVIIYTGGTTGAPKGACLSHSNIMSNVLAGEEWLRIVETPGKPPKRPEKGGRHAILGVLPWYHSFGLTSAMLAACNGASRLICMPDPRAGDPPFTEILRNIQTYGATSMPAVPTIFSAIVHHPRLEQFDLSSIIGCGSGAAPLPLEVIRQFEEKTGAVIYEGYGLTETSPVLTSNPTTVENRKVGTVGLPIPGTEIRILDAETNSRELPQREDGEIAAAGPQIMLGYWNRPEENEAAFREIDGKRFFLTGDIGHLDEDGFLVITDRKKDLILVGGFNVYPREVEEVLYTHSKVALAAVIGVADDHTGESVKAFIQLKPGVEASEDEFLAFCKERMAGYKRPRSVEFRENLPTSVIGKVLRRELREEERRSRM
jgi:long-chain acyl-CoA synthetase